jgi:hypothetical protein
MKGTGFSPYISPEKQETALAAEGTIFPSNRLFPQAPAVKSHTYEGFGPWKHCFTADPAFSLNKLYPSESRDRAIFISRWVRPPWSWDISASLTLL